MGIGLRDLLIIIVVAGLGLSIIAGMVYGTILAIRRLFRK